MPQGGRLGGGDGASGRGSPTVLHGARRGLCWSWHQKAWPRLMSSPDPGSEGGQTPQSQASRSLSRGFLGPEASASSGSLPRGPRGIRILGLAPSWLKGKPSLTQSTGLMATPPGMKLWENHCYPN